MNNNVGFIFFINVLLLMPQQAFSAAAAAKEYHDEAKKAIKQRMEGDPYATRSRQISYWIKDLAFISDKVHNNWIIANNKGLLKDMRPYICELYKQEILNLIKDTDINDLLTPYSGDNSTILHQIAQVKFTDVIEKDAQVTLQGIAQVILVNFQKNHLLLMKSLKIC